MTTWGNLNLRTGKRPKFNIQKKTSSVSSSNLPERVIPTTIGNWDNLIAIERPFQIQKLRSRYHSLPNHLHSNIKFISMHWESVPFLKLRNVHWGVLIDPLSGMIGQFDVYWYQFSGMIGQFDVHWYQFSGMIFTFLQIWEGNGEASVVEPKILTSALFPPLLYVG